MGNQVYSFDMLSDKNIFSALKYLDESDDESNEELEYSNDLINLIDSPNNKISKNDSIDIGLEFVNSKPINLNKCKRFYRKNRSKRINVYKQIYSEMDNIPVDFADAMNKKQNLTLKQILVLMNLQAIPEILLNNIHDNIQNKVKKSKMKISNGYKIFYVKCYNWYDLTKIEKMIDEMLTSY